MPNTENVVQTRYEPHLGGGQCIEVNLSVHDCSHAEDGEEIDFRGWGYHAHNLAEDHILQWLSVDWMGSGRHDHMPKPGGLESL